MLEHKGYVGTIEVDEGAFSGRVSGLRDVITFEGETFAKVEQVFRAASTIVSPSAQRATNRRIDLETAA